MKDTVCRRDETGLKHGKDHRINPGSTTYSLYDLGCVILFLSHGHLI